MTTLAFALALHNTWTPHIHADDVPALAAACVLGYVLAHLAGAIRARR